MWKSAGQFLLFALRAGLRFFGPLLGATGLLGAAAAYAGVPLWFAFVAVLLGLALGLVTLAGVRLQHREGDGPQLRYHAVREHTHGNTSFAVLSVINGSQGDRRARELPGAWPRLVYRAMNGETFREERGRWSDQVQPADKTLRPNGDSHSFFLARKEIPGDHCFLATWESEIDLQTGRFRLPERFVVEVSICGDNYESLLHRVEVGHGGPHTPMEVRTPPADFGREG